MWKKYNHIMITIVLVAIAIPFEFEIYTLLVLSGFWFGREHSQAEYRYMKLKSITRSKLVFFDGFRKEAWDKDSLINDLMLPIVVGLLMIGVINWHKEVGYTIAEVNRPLTKDEDNNYIDDITEDELFVSGKSFV